MFSTKQEQLDDLLHRIGESLQVTPTMYELAESRYKTISSWLDKWDEPMRLLIYPQGSFRIGTTVKPIKGEEFDLDFVCEFKVPWQSQDPQQVLHKLFNRMKENGTYKDMVELKRRCIRVNYKNEFHMDILPAFQVGNNGSLKVPDRVLGWKDSNPKGYGDWFEEQSAIHPQKIYLEKRAEVEPLRGHETIDEKSTLARIVQLIKRYRDIEFQDDLDSAPISIVLTTLAAKHYNGQRSVIEGLVHIIDSIQLEILSARKDRVMVLNPRNSAEDLSERWDGDRKLYQHFVRFVTQFKSSLSEIRNAANFVEASKLFVTMFGEQLTKSALEKQAEIIRKSQKSGNLGVVSRGLLTSTAVLGSTPVKANTFYGSEE